MGLMDSPTDVLLQTTDHFGSTFLAMRSISDMWISGIVPDGTDLPLIRDQRWHVCLSEYRGIARRFLTKTNNRPRSREARSDPVL